MIKKGKIIDMLYIPSFNIAEYFIGVVLVNWLFSRDSADFFSVELSSQFLFRTGRSGVKIIK